MRGGARSPGDRQQRGNDDGTGLPTARSYAEAYERAGPGRVLWDAYEQRGPAGRTDEQALLHRAAAASTPSPGQEAASARCRRPT